MCSSASKLSIAATVAALYRCDGRGRLVSINQWDGGVAPRFFLMRTPDQVICRFRADLPAEIARRLAVLCSEEPKGESPGELPARYDEYLDVLASHAPVTRIWAGPAYAFPRDVVPGALPTMIVETNAHFLRTTFEGWLPDVLHRQPFVAMIEDDHAVSICASVRISEEVHCAGVETHATYRHRGHAVNVVAGWAIAVRSMGAAPFYSTSWDNIASRRLAARLRLSLVGVDFHVT